MKNKNILAAVAAASVLCCANVNADAKAYCFMPNLSIKHGESAHWYSDHRAVLVNDTNEVQVYHLDFFHEVPGQGSPYKSFDLGLAPGQSHDTGVQRYTTKIETKHKDKIPSTAYTLISVSGKYVSTCQHTGTINVF